jgi:dGTPase
VNDNGLKPRVDLFELNEFKKNAEYQPATWEGCVVKIADKIAYLGRDIEDAITLGFLNEAEQNELLKMAREIDEDAMNTTVIMHNMILDICKNSSPEKGICLSPAIYKQMEDLKDFNTKHIYSHPRFNPFKEYSDLILTQIFNALYVCYDGRHTIQTLLDKLTYAPQLQRTFTEWLARYCVLDIIPDEKIHGNKSLKAISLECENEKIYGYLKNKKVYVQTILDYISGMTDRFAIAVFNELITY